MNKNRRSGSLAFGLTILLISLALFLRYLFQEPKISVSVALTFIGCLFVYRAIKDNKMGLPTKYEYLDQNDAYEVKSVLQEWKCLLIIDRSAQKIEGELILIEETGFPRKLKQPGTKFIPSKVPDDYNLHPGLL